MKALQYFILTLFFSLFMNCNNNVGINLKLNQHLNDTSHFGNAKILGEKKAILKVLEEFDDWYRNETGNIRYNFGKEYWKMGYEHRVDDDERIKELQENIIPKIQQIEFFTEKIKHKVVENAKIDDPGNIGYILSGSEYGKSLIYIENINGDHPFEGNLFLNFSYSEDPDEPEIRAISKEEKEFYHLSFIGIVDNTNAIYRAHLEVTNYADYPVNHGFLVINMMKENENWLIDDLSYIEKEELIETEEGYSLPDYFKYKLDYEGIRIDPDPNPIP